MIKKDYYRYDELSPRFNILDADLVYWHEKRLLSFVIPQLIQDYIIGGWIKGGGFRGYGVVEYKGLISIPSSTEKLILEKGKSHIGDCWLLELDKIKYLDDSYRFSVPLPNSLIHSWQSRSLVDIDWDIIPAKRFPTVQKESSIQPFIKAMESIKNKEFKPMSHFEADLKDILSPPYLEIKKQELCITHENLIKLGIIESDKKPEGLQEISKNTPLLNAEPQESDKRSSQLSALIERMLLAKPNLKTIEVWRLLRAETELDIMERTYDNEGILMDMTANDLLWVSRYGNQSNVLKSTFDSKVSRIRKKLGINKK
ncbi:hypothetical protein [Paraglaciecola hydrolytica]|uniref:Uncharacterized protein n=1 Tax=Paraglaciecola hydrolytica TaxID=1799789 RepID=A0A148KKE5_9ALTE|nr:hypothetical protein [Paraglaciecola hydrolytica]KXI26792.1 hypothetical protein AX660_03210 [Paraglaciecola hydrolytica]